MSTQGLGEGPIGDVSEITGGTQNIMLRFTRAGREYVFRRGPRHLRPVSNTVILRETQVLRALADTDVPHPRLIAVCEDTSVLGDAVFYLMEPIAGFNAGAGLPALHAGDADIRHGMGLSMADAAARLGAVDHGRSAWEPSASRPDSWNGKSRAGFPNSSPTRNSTTIPAPTSATWTRWRPGCANTNRRNSAPESCTATTTPPT